ncbi:zinc finger protein 507-like [Megalops cyprinoides]|uniref:zinc finger protein 507-like n=1 Tax=Megalops cyprinoides TaxID=118141 RepID=UPI001864E4A9|nr:zinc finger protein 507-like [Megalops cyprinoides]
MENSSGGAVLVPHTRGQQDAVCASECMVAVSATPQDSDGEQKARKQAADSLFQVIEKLSKIVEKQPRRCSLLGRKRPRLPCPPVAVQGAQAQSAQSTETTLEKARGAEGTEAGDDSRKEALEEIHLSEGASEGAVTFYQCGLCRFASPMLPSLKEHLLQHHKQQQGDVVLMCAECNFTSRQQEELEAHIRLHLDSGDAVRGSASEPPGDVGSELECSGVGAEGVQLNTEGGAARVTLDSTEGEPPKKKWYSQEQPGTYRCLICSYVCGQQRMLKTHAWKHAGLVDCSYPIFEDESEMPSQRGPTTPPSPPEETLVVLTAVGGDPEATLELSPEEKPAVEEDEEASVAMVPVAEEQAVEVEVRMETEAEQERDTPGGSDSLLSSAQKIISSGPNVAGHLNVIVERLPGASKPFLLPLEEESEGPLEVQGEEVEVAQGSSGGVEQDAPAEEPEGGEGVPPARKRTHSECLRLHSLAAEVLVAMPMRAPEPARADAPGATDSGAPTPATGQCPVKIATPSPALQTDPPPAEKQPRAAVVPGEAAGDSPVKTGISVSLLAVIERLRERGDQDVSDEDILRELWDGGRGPAGGEAGLPEGSLVEVDPGSERPYRCRLCRYASANKGYVKQHLRAHRPKRPYQCPICEHVAADSKALEKHMIHHCKSRMHLCKQCNQAFCYKSQLRNHEKDQHELGDTSATTTPPGETMVTTPQSQGKMTVQEPSRVQKIYRCDVCDYSSATYVGVRNHRRIHNSDKPYRCCSCDFATTNMNSLRGHLRKHPQELQGMQLLEQYRCSLCGYVCSHPPSLKSHMWKHAGDQNYNYEQVNRAIDEAISQSSRAQAVHQKPSLERASPVEEGVEKATPRADPPAAGAGVLTESPPGSAQIGRPPAVPRQVGAPSWQGTEYCMLLFCCCICGFESTTKEQLMQHMKDHEGEIISIILSREQGEQRPL